MIGSTAGIMRRINEFMGKGPTKWLAQQAKNHKRIIEVGVWKGLTTRVLAENTLGTVWAVDHWQGVPHDPEQSWLYEHPVSVYTQFCKNNKRYLESGKVKPIKMDSKTAALALFTWYGKESFDMIFIDADHSYEGCKTDIANYWPLLKHGGLFCGHDYTERWPGVVKAVDEAFKDVTIGPRSIWSLIKI